MNEYVHAIRTRRTHEFRLNYRDGINIPDPEPADRRDAPTGRKLVLTRPAD